MTGLDATAADPCGTCPWRNENHGKRHPDGWYTRRNQDRLWGGLRRGDAMSCHPTDPGNEVSPAAQAAGYKPAPEGAKVIECRGGMILQQREMHLLQEDHDNDLSAYRRARPFGLTRDGVRELVLRLLLGGVPFVGGRKMPLLNLDLPVSHHRLPWTGMPGAQPREEE